MKRNDIISEGDWMLHSIQKYNQEGDYDLLWDLRRTTLFDIMFWHDNDWEDSDYEEFLKPIPLSVEILVRNGFREDGPRCYALEPGGDTKVHVIVGDSGSVVMLVAESERAFFRFYGNVHVHELQHVYRMCGINGDIYLDGINVFD